MSKKLTPISGFPEFLPNEQATFQWALDIVRKAFEEFGFVPMETPAVERVDHLLEKGIQGKEVYVLRRFHDEGSSPAELALHFDLTVPLARYVAQHYGQLTFPFKRYQIQPVWRGERPQAGRYRQFYQCDIDVIGDGEVSIYFDAEIPAVIAQVFSTMNIGPFTIRMNHRKVLQGLLQSVGINEQPRVHQAIKIIDDMEKVSPERTRASFEELGISSESIDQLFTFFAPLGSVQDTLNFLSTHSLGEHFEAGVKDLKDVVNFLEALKVPKEHYTIDLKIARGLDYYTGIVYETILNDHPQLGSICSGGRYDDLAGAFINKKLPGVGISIGLSRLIPQLIKEGVLQTKNACPAPVLITTQNPERLSAYLDMACALRQAGVATEVYLEKKKLKAQLKYADKKGFQLLVIADEPEFEKGEVMLKNMASGEQTHVPIEALVAKVCSILLSK